MQLYPLLRTSFVCWTPLSPDEARKHLQESLDTQLLEGRLDNDRFSVVHRSMMTKNSWRPRIHGKLSSLAGGTLVEATLSVHPFVAVFTVVHGMLLFGLSWLVGIVAFSMEVGPALKALQGAVGATLVGEQQVSSLPVSDPTQPGAESHPPYLLQASVSDQGVTFSVPQRRSLFGHGPLVRTEVSVARQGASVGDVLIPWDQLVRSDLAEEQDGRVLLLSGPGDQPQAHIPCDELPREAALWLAAYLDAQIRRFALPPEEKHRQDNERAKLAQLVDTTRTRVPQ